MAIRAQKYREIVESYLEVLDYQAASELTQAMEARGDFKYKGIFRLFNSILDWTSKFSANGILPTKEQLSRDNDMEIDRVRYYLDELMGKSPSQRMIVAMPAVDFVGGPRSELIRFVVYCRPEKKDGITAMKYYQAYQEKNLKAVSRWLASRPVRSGSEYADLIYERIEQGRLPDTQDGADIARNFYSELDTAPEKKRNTYTLFARPIIQKLIESRELLYLTTREGSSIPYKAIFVNQMEQLQIRFRVLAEYFLSNINPSGGSNDPTPEVIRPMVEKLVSGGLASLQAGYQQTVLELLLLIPTISRLQAENEEKARQQEMENLMSDLAKKSGIVDVTRMKFPNEGVKNSILHSAQIYYTEFPINGRLGEYILHTQAVSSAIKSASDRLEKTGDDTEVMILSSMGIEKQLEGEKLIFFQELEQRSLFNRLPWFIKVWRAILGRNALRPEEAIRIKMEQSRSLDEEKLRIRTSEARKAQKRLVSERMKEGKAAVQQTSPGGSESRGAAQSSSYSGDEGDGAGDEDSSSGGLTEKSEESLKAEETLKKIVTELDKAWDEKLFPGRDLLLAKFPEFTEDSLIFFLKKYGRKEILSFRISHDKPEYKWPILVTRRYIKVNGKKLLSKAMADADEQRSAMMPNQEKFDIATSLEDFLNRVLSRM